MNFCYRNAKFLKFFDQNAKFMNFFDRAMGILLFQEESMPKTQNPCKMVSRHEKTTEWVFMKNIKKIENSL